MTSEEKVRAIEAVLSGEEWCAVGKHWTARVRSYQWSGLIPDGYKPPDDQLPMCWRCFLGMRPDLLIANPEEPQLPGLVDRAGQGSRGSAIRRAVVRRRQALGRLCRPCGGRVNSRLGER